jgi:hypothetical protein
MTRLGQTEYLLNKGNINYERKTFYYVETTFSCQSCRNWCAIHLTYNDILSMVKLNIKYNRKKLCEYQPGGLYYKTFYGRNCCRIIIG